MLYIFLATFPFFWMTCHMIYQILSNKNYHLKCFLFCLFLNFCKAFVIDNLFCVIKRNQILKLLPHTFYQFILLKCHLLPVYNVINYFTNQVFVYVILFVF